ncbi:HEAT repeat domain-containing protein [Nitrososphaera viennensis]|nr:HEAT repeat domain-containing protein [Nitrososphaera viennensis]
MKEDWSISELIAGLHVDDDISDIKDMDASLIPQKSIEGLIALGKQAVPKLTQELQDYQKNESYELYAQFIVDILGEIKDPSAVPELIKLFKVEFDDSIGEHTVSSLQKIGTAAVPMLVEALHQNQDNVILVMYILDTLRGIPSPDAITAALDTLAKSTDDDLKEYAIDIIERQGSVMHIPALENLLDDQKKSLFDYAKNAIRRICKDNPRVLREVLLKHKAIGPERMKNLGRGLESITRNMSYRYSEYDYGKYTGDTAEELNEAVRQFRIRRDVIKGLKTITEIGLDEAVLSFNNFNRVTDIIDELKSLQDELIRKYGDALILHDWEEEYYNEPVKKVETKSFKKKLSEIGQIIPGVNEWLRSKGFKVNELSSTIVARDEKRRTCFIGYDTTEGKRVYSDVKLRLHGRGWEDEEVLSFADDFWRKIETLVRNKPS